VPVLMGGVGAAQLLATAALLALLVVLALGASVLASAGGRGLLRTLVLAFVFEAVGLWLVYEAFDAAWVLRTGLKWSRVDVGDGALARLHGAWLLLSNTGPGLAMRTVPLFARGTPPPGALSPAEWAAPTLLGLVLAAFAIVLVVTGWHLRRSVHERPPTAAELERRAWWTRARFFPGAWRRLRLRLLARNPLLWLQRRSPALAVARWVWLGLVAILWVNTLQSSRWAWDGRSGTAYFAALLLVLGIAFSAALSLREEGRNGVLELLLVTGLREEQLLRSAVWNSAGLFVPAVLLHAAVATHLDLASGNAYATLGFGPVLLGAVFVAPLVAFGFNLRGRPLPFTVGWTLFGAVVVPWLGAWLAIVLFLVMRYGGFLGGWVNLLDPAVQLVTMLLQVALGAVAWKRGRAELVTRRFVTRRGAVL
jgi:hypothetical protein